MNFPVPDQQALEHSAKVTDYIIQQIQNAGGCIPFAEFMQLALYAPGLGYYSAGTHKLGKSGDFVTAPEISPLFAQSIARQFQQILISLEGGYILELGAGSGIFAKDVMLELERLKQLPTRYFILEVSADLRARQEALLQKECPHLFNRFVWLKSLPEDFIGIIFANEVMDALPVNLFQMTDSGIKERCVSVENKAFAWQLQDASADVVNQLQDFDFPVGYQSEINLYVKPWITSLAGCLQQGVLLLLDYGYGRREYYHPGRLQGTLTCFYQHRKYDNPFLYVGLQDITAHVDFTSVVEVGISAGLSFAGFTTQTSFLLACGILDLAGQVDTDAIQKYQQSQAIKTLTLPSEMGEIVKVIGFYKNFDENLLGFQFQDRSRDL